MYMIPEEQSEKFPAESSASAKNVVVELSTTLRGTLNVPPASAVVVAESDPPQAPAKILTVANGSAVPESAGELLFAGWSGLRERFTGALGD